MPTKVRWVSCRSIPPKYLFKKTPLFEWQIHLDNSRRGGSAAAGGTEARCVNGSSRSSLATAGKSITLGTKHTVEKRSHRIDLFLHDLSHILFKVWDQSLRDESESHGCCFSVVIFFSFRTRIKNDIFMAVSSSECMPVREPSSSLIVVVDQQLERKKGDGICQKGKNHVFLRNAFVPRTTTASTETVSLLRELLGMGFSSCTIVAPCYKGNDPLQLVLFL